MNWIELWAKMEIIGTIIGVLLFIVFLILKFKDQVEMQMSNDEIMERYFEIIIDLALDYDGFKTVKGLKDLIDELVRFAKLGRDCNITEPIYENNGKKYNIIHEELIGDVDNE